MPRHWIIGSCYLLIAALNIYRAGLRSPNWIPWILLAVGVLGLEYTPAEERGKKRQTIVFSDRNKASIAATVLGFAISMGIVVFPQPAVRCQNPLGDIQKLSRHWPPGGMLCSSL